MNKNYKILYNITFDEVQAAYYQAKRHKKNSKACIEFTMDLAGNLYRLWLDIRTGRYKIGKSSCFVVSRPKHREVFAADFRDRIVHHIIISKLMPLFQRDFIRNSFSCMPGRGTMDGVLRLQEAMKRHPKGYVAKFDIVGFFMHINKYKLLDMLRVYIKNNFHGEPDTMNLLLYLAEIIVLHRPEKNCIRNSPKWKWNFIASEKSLFTLPEYLGLAIGNLTSQLFAGLYLMAFDYFMYSIFKDDYGRYVDDFYVVSDSSKKIMKVVPRIRIELQKVGLTLHSDKFYIQPVCHGCKFIGSFAYPTRIYTGNYTLENFYNIAKYYSNVPEINIEELLGLYRRLNSYLGFLVHYSEYRTRAKVLGILKNSTPFHYLQFSKSLKKVEPKKEFKLLKLAL